MTATCQLTGAKPSFGKQVSHSHVRTSRRWVPNLQRRKYYVPSLGRTVTLTLSVRAIRTIDRIGIEVAVAKIRARGERV